MLEHVELEHYASETHTFLFPVFFLLYYVVSIKNGTSNEKIGGLFEHLELGHRASKKKSAKRLEHQGIKTAFLSVQVTAVKLITK